MISLLSTLTLDNLIGEGGSGRIFAAASPDGGRVAVKVVARNNNASSIEATALHLLGATLPSAALTLPPTLDPPVGHSHPHVVHLEAPPEFTSDSCFFIMTEGETDLLDRFYAYCEARDAGVLSDVVMDNYDISVCSTALECVGQVRRRGIDAGGLPFQVVRSYFEQIASAVRFSESKGVFHGDIKPENCLVTTEVDADTGQGNDVILLCDFGSASLVRLSSKATGSVAYSAPEVLPLFHRIVSCESPFSTCCDPSPHEHTRQRAADAHSCWYVRRSRCRHMVAGRAVACHARGLHALR